MITPFACEINYEKGSKHVVYLCKWNNCLNGLEDRHIK